MRRPSFTRGYASTAKDSSPRRHLLGAWAPFLGVQGITLADLSGNRNHLPLLNTTPSTLWQPHPLGHVIAFDGVDDFASIATLPPILQTTQAITIELWFMPNTGFSHTPFQYLIDTNGDDDIVGWNLQTGDGAGYLTLGSVIQDWVLTGWAMTPGVMYQLVITYDRANLTFYVNGRVLKTGAFTTAIGYGGGTLNFGTALRLIPGAYGLMRVYGRALSAGEVLTQYADPLAMFRLQPHVWGSVSGPTNNDSLAMMPSRQLIMWP